MGQFESGCENAIIKYSSTINGPRNGTEEGWNGGSCDDIVLIRTFLAPRRGKFVVVVFFYYSFSLFVLFETPHSVSSTHLHNWNTKPLPSDASSDRLPQETEWKEVKIVNKGSFELSNSYSEANGNKTKKWTVLVNAIFGGFIPISPKIIRKCFPFMKGGCPEKLMFQKLGLGSGAYNH